MEILLKPYNLSILIGLLASLGYSIRFIHEKDKSQWIITGLLFFVLAFELYAYQLFREKKSTLMLYNICFVYLETTLLFLYFKQIATSVQLKKYLTVFPIALFFFGFLNHYFWQSFLTSYQSFSFLLAALGISLFCCLYFWEIIRYNRYIDQPLYTVPHFWNVAVILAFYSASFLYFLSVTNILVFLFQNEFFLGTLLAQLNQFLAGFLYLVLGFSFWLSKTLNPKSRVQLG